MTELLRASLHTRHFDFEVLVPVPLDEYDDEPTALGKAEVHAKALLIRGWEVHCAEFRDADPEYMRDNLDDVFVERIPLVAVLRDGDSIYAEAVDE